MGGEKNNFLIRGAEVVSRAGGMRSIRGPEVSLGSLRVGTRRAQSPTPYTLALGSYLPILLAVQLPQAWNERHIFFTNVGSRSRRTARSIRNT
jgi:hypothetical protein